MFAWLPIIGPIIQGIVDTYKSRNDTKVALSKVEGEKYVTDVRSSDATLALFRYDYGSMITRDLIMFPVGCWTALFVWDKIVDLKYPSLVWGVAPMTEASGLAFLPYAVITFLFGVTAVREFRK